MQNGKNTDASQKEEGLKEQQITHFKSPPKDSEDETTKLGEETPDPTTQGYSEDHIVPDPNDKTKKRSLGSPKK